MMSTKHFLKTREYLGQVKAAAQKVEMLKERIGYYEKRVSPPMISRLSWRRRRENSQGKWSRYPT